MIAVEIPSRKILPRRAVLRRLVKGGFKFTGLFTDDLSGCFFDIIVLRIVDIDFDLGQGIGISWRVLMGQTGNRPTV